MPAQAKNAPFPSDGMVEEFPQTEKSLDSSGTATSTSVIPEDEPIDVVTKPEEEQARKEDLATSWVECIRRKMTVIQEKSEQGQDFRSAQSKGSP